MRNLIEKRSDEKAWAGPRRLCQGKEKIKKKRSRLSLCSRSVILWIGREKKKRYPPLRTKRGGGKALTRLRFYYDLKKRRGLTHRTYTTYYCVPHWGEGKKKESLR